MNSYVKGILSAGRPSTKKNRVITIDSLVDKITTVRVNFDLNIDQHTKLKLYAVKNRKSIREVLSECIVQLPK